jgi:betaine-aldehyde dehydrogenase
VCAEGSYNVRNWDRLYIDGAWVTPSSPNVIEVVSPHTAEVVATCPEAVQADVDRAVQAARTAFDHGEWSGLQVSERLSYMRRLHEIYTENMTAMNSLITEEMGSPISFGQAGAAWMTLSTTLGVAESYPWEERRQGALGEVLVRREPVGVIAAIVPWNVPQFIIMNKIAPALIAGCTVVLKPAPEAPLDALFLAEMVAQAGLPAGTFNVVPAGREVGEYLVGHPGVDKVTFTGSTAAGKRVATVCGANLTRCSLELGGKSAAVILDDADLDVVASGLKMASFMNSGQACVAQTRVLASRANYGKVVDALVSMVEGLKVGDPSDPATDIGPLVARRQQERTEEYISLGRQEGATVAIGGSGSPEGLERGWYVRPTLFTNAHNKMRVAREEIFGPVVTVIPYEDIADAVEIANDSDYGLAGSVWTADQAGGIEVARRIRTGTLGINKYGMDMAAPFGGYKQSGIGRELGAEGLTSFIEYKSIAL